MTQAHAAGIPAAAARRLARRKPGHVGARWPGLLACRRRAIASPRAALPSDAPRWWTTDPESTPFTRSALEPVLSDHAVYGELHASGAGDGDYNKFHVLASRADKAGVLSAATGGQPERSDRYRHVLAPLDYRHELRPALSDNFALWGGIALLRQPGAPDFPPAEARRFASLGTRGGGPGVPRDRGTRARS